MKNALYAGTFDPITYGHLDIIIRASKIFTHLTVAIAVNKDKKPLLSIEDRVKLVKNEMKTLPNTDNITISAFDGLLVDFASKNNISIIVRGIRAVSDFEYEFQMSCMNQRLNKDIYTIFLPASEKTQFISSKFVKSIAKLNGDISSLVPAYTANILKKLYQS